MYPSTQALMTFARGDLVSSLCVESICLVYHVYPAAARQAFLSFYAPANPADLLMMQVEAIRAILRGETRGL